MASAEERAKVEEIESWLKRHILSICTLSAEERHKRPSMKTVKERIERAYDKEESELLVGYIEEREGDERGFWKELDEYRERLESQGEWVREGHGTEKGFEGLIKLLARAEVEQLVETRVRWKGRRKWEGGEGKLERELEMVENVGQGSRGVQAPSEKFLALGRKFGEGERGLYYGILLEEMALQELEPYLQGESNNGVSWYAVPPSMWYIRQVAKRKGGGMVGREDMVRFGWHLPRQAAQVRQVHEELGVAFGGRRRKG